MDNAARQAIVTELVRLARSPDFRDRTVAGCCLAHFADTDDARPSLLELVQDAEDTGVMVKTVEALLRRTDTAGMSIVCVAAATAEYERVDWLYGTVVDVFGVFERHRDAAAGICRALSDDLSEDDQVRAGASRLLEYLADVQPILRSVERS